MNKTGSTLIEIMIIIIIVGALAIVAIPKFSYVAERGQAQEAYSIFSAVRAAQMAYKIENDKYATSVNQLDVELSIPPYFSGLSLFDATQPGAGTISHCPPSPPMNEKYFAYLNGRNGLPKPYTLFLQESGNIVCIPFGGCPAAGQPNLCKKLGF